MKTWAELSLMERLRYHAEHGDHYSDLTGEAAERIEELEAENARLREKKPTVTTSPNGIRQTTPSEILGSEKGREAVEKAVEKTLRGILEAAKKSHHEGDFS